MTLIARSAWILLLLVATLLAACVSCRGPSRTVTLQGAAASGPMQVEERPVSGPIRHIEARGVLTVRVRNADQPAIRVRAQAEILPKIRTEVVGDRLRLSFTEEALVIGNGMDPTVEIDTPGFTSLDVWGVVTVDAHGFQDGAGDAAIISVNGTNTVTVSGRVSAVRVTCQGVSTAYLENLVADRWTVAASGTSTCQLAGRAAAVDLTAEGVSTINAHDMTVGTAELAAHGTSSVRLGHAGSVRQQTSGLGSVLVGQP
jgi:hypothetical protein